ncbi:PepSY domain-containing protein [Ketogulonicigenium vulgare]|uniref:Peptidase domain protein n=1 Tax=Ketogulonicigenium vulgare (strain WSH-001) TaxID=759362 RepID=F9YB76_KETVW|nr:PepSY domain-containing protein [Ketogulonicigenium vulgare]ADO44105.1 membrane protein [Ketogulonicigenium vulgare Y25]AEM42628.1 Peptidase domain protein [Ketogulonicigenium vulgare WSH-001]ALJ82652.1 peptidase [Ketogulonicigenium vulgare]ANW35449.1 peptidase [Ketogulonicigenium vulgare]AOZ53330.1 membrane protein [Ketogulonicigenium vulgare]
MKHLILPFVCLLALPAAADSDQDRARDALARGEILPLSTILARIEADVAGRVIEVDYDEDDGRFIYEIEMLLFDGRLLELEIDAQTGVIIDSEYEDDD